MARQARGPSAEARQENFSSSEINAHYKQPREREKEIDIK